MTTGHRTWGWSALLALSLGLLGCGQAAPPVAEPAPSFPISQAAAPSGPSPTALSPNRSGPYKEAAADFDFTSTRPADPDDPPPDTTVPRVPYNDPATGKYIVQVEVTVTRLHPEAMLLDAVSGERSRHQRMDVRRDNGELVFLAHNLNLAPAVPCAVGDQLKVRGEYLVTAPDDPKYPQDVLHWTHHDPKKKHPEGYIIWNGRKYG